MFMVMGKFSIDPEQRNEFLGFVREIIPGERQTPGIISFEIYEDVLETNTFLMVEQWEDEDALDLYTASDEYLENDDRLNSFVIGEPVWEEYEF
ncbi:MAG: putative quinol monooxygenase [Chloroflexota bacterium]